MQRSKGAGDVRGRGIVVLGLVFLSDQKTCAPLPFPHPNLSLYYYRLRRGLSVQHGKPLASSVSTAQAARAPTPPLSPVSRLGSVGSTPVVGFGSRRRPPRSRAGGQGWLEVENMGKVEAGSCNY